MLFKNKRLPVQFSHAGLIGQPRLYGPVLVAVCLRALVTPPPPLLCLVPQKKFMMAGGGTVE